MASSPSAYFGALVSHETALWNAIDRRLAREGQLRLGRLEFLRALASNESTRIQDLADALRITVGAASRLTDRLVADRLVARVPHPTDRRSSYVRITEEGERALATTQSVFTRTVNELLGSADAAELATLTRAFERLDAQLAAGRDGHGAGPEVLSR